MGERIHCHLIGRSSRRAEIVIEDPDHTVSALHAELVHSEDDRWYLTDCASANGTFVWRNGEWLVLRQEFIAPGERLRFGTLEVQTDWLIEQAQQREADRSAHYQRDPATGELHWESGG